MTKYLLRTTLYLLGLTLITATTRAQIVGEWRHFHNTSSTRAMVKDGPYLWVATDGGLAQYDTRTDTVIHFYNTDNSAIPANDVWKLAIDKQRGLWVSTRSGGLARLQNGSWTYFNANNSPLIGTDGGIIAVDSLDRLWVGKRNGLFRYTEGSWRKFDSLTAPLSTNVIECIAADRKGNIWIGTSYEQGVPRNRGYVLKFDGSSNWEVHNDTLDGFWVNDTTLAHELQPQDPWCMLVDDSGAVWIGFDQVINRQFSNHSWITYRDPQSFDNVIYTLAQDRKGVVWAGDEYGAVRIVDTAYQRAVVTQFPYSSYRKGFPFFGASAIIPVGDSLWIAGAGSGGIAYGLDSSWTIRNRFDDCPFESDQPYSMTEDSRGRYWFGMRLNPFLYMFDGSRWTVYDSLSYGSNGILALAADSTGNVWIGLGGGGIVKFDGNTALRFDLHKVDSFSNVIYALMWDKRRHALWVGNGWEGGSLYKSGVAMFNGDSWVTYPYTSSQTQSFTLDTAGNVWAASYDLGVFKFDGMTWQSFTSSNSALPSNSELSLAADRNGGVWAATGPAYCDGATWHTFPFASVVAGTDAVAIDTAGRVWFGGFPGNPSGGATVYDGKTWTSYRINNSKINAFRIWTTMADRSGNVWFGTNGQGLVEFVPTASASVPQSDAQGTALLYPSPAHTTISLAGPSGAIEVFDAAGRRFNCVRSHDKIDISSLPAGVYYLRTADENARFVKE